MLCRFVDPFVKAYFCRRRMVALLFLINRISNKSNCNQTCNIYHNLSLFFIFNPCDVLVRSMSYYSYYDTLGRKIIHMYNTGPTLLCHLSMFRVLFFFFLERNEFCFEIQPEDVLNSFGRPPSLHCLSVLPVHQRTCRHRVQAKKKKILLNK